MIAFVDPVQLALWLWIIPQAIGFVITALVVGFTLFAAVVILLNK